MICKKCEAEFENSPVCPQCGYSEVPEEKKEFTVTIDEEKYISQQDENTENEAVTKTDEEEDRKVTYKEKRKAYVAEKSKEKLKAQRKKERGASRFIVSAVCVMAVIMLSLSVLSISTDIFEADDDAVKTVALSSLSVADEAELQDYLSAFYVLKDIVLDDDTASDEFYPFFMPHSEVGILKKSGEDPEIITARPDPAKRFSDENGNFAYYKIEAQTIDLFIERFGLIPNHTLNLKNIYYYNGYYYFANLQSEKAESNVEAEIVSSKRIQDGSYYVECIFYSADSYEGKELCKMYVIANKQINGTENIWNISRVSSEPIFDKSGIMIENDGPFKYEMKREFFKGELSDSTVFCEYSVEYPFFKGDSPVEQAVNMLYSEVIAQYKQSAEEADEQFKNYKGEKSELPIVVHISSEVTFSDDRYVSTIVDISEYNPQNIKKDDSDEAEDVPAVTVSKRNVEGYIFDAVTGEFLSKDTVIGKNYQLVCDLLYRINGGYSYDDLLDETISRPSSIPPDNVTGKKIYEAGSSLTPNGYVFCNITDEGYVKSVLLPNSVLEKLKD